MSNDFDIDPANFHHRDHVRLAWTLLDRYPFGAALARFSDGLRAFATRIGKPGVYHETITCAYMILIHARRRAGETWEAFAARNADLFAWKPSILDRYYSPELLGSDRARTTFVLPDLIDELREPAA